MTTSLQLPQDVDAMQAIKDSLAKIEGIDQFTNAATAYIQGETEVEETVKEMMEFLMGDVSGNSVQKQRLITLAQQVGPECATISITLLTLTACTAAFSCSGGCC
jgi:hypothetical protein